MRLIKARISRYMPLHIQFSWVYNIGNIGRPSHVYWAILHGIFAFYCDVRSPDINDVAPVNFALFSLLQCVVYIFVCCFVIDIVLFIKYWITWNDSFEINMGRLDLGSLFV